MINNSNKIQVISGVKGNVVLSVPELRLNQRWARKGAKALIDRETLEEAYYLPGVEYMFSHGLIYTTDEQFLVDVGLKTVDDRGKEVASVVILTDAQMQRYLTVAPIAELKELMPKLSHEQATALADYAIEHNLADMTRADIIKPYAKKDIIKALIQKREMEEIDKMESLKKEG